MTENKEIEFNHYSVLLNETIDGLDIKADGIYVDCTLGGAGHSEEILKRLAAMGGKGRLISIDRDPEAISVAKDRLSKYGDRSIIVKGRFSTIAEILTNLGITEIDGLTADLGVSSRQLDEASRGFSFHHDAPLDMRMSKGEGISAYDVVNTYDERELRRILTDYGEEKFSSRIASFIVRERSKKPIETTFELTSIIKDAIPAKFRKDGPHPSRRSFQAIRMAVNLETYEIETLIKEAFPFLKSEGRMSIITFHSIEDRIVKHSYLSYVDTCTCPPDFPKCVCGKKPLAKIITKKPILPSESELEENSRSRSAKLRILEKI